MVNWRLDHVVVAVHDLDQATDDYRQLGFTVVRGGTHPGGWTQNALIGLDDGTYLELLAPTDVRFLSDPEALSARNFLFALGTEGITGLALTCDNLNEAVAAMQARGVAIDAPRPGGRLRPDGVRLEWRIAMQERNLLPFFLQDLTPRSLRVPSEPSAVRHPNGARGVLEFTIGCNAPAFWQARLSALLGPSTSDDVWSLGGTVLRLEHSVAAPSNPALSAILRCDTTFVCDREKLHGARLGVHS